jgi:uncharacterized membrane protein YeaQ/YmgE (transglycosylase-associated protein family)
MVSFLAHKRECTLVLTVVVLMLLVGLLSSPHPALAQSAVTLDPTEGLPGTEVTVEGSGWSAGHQVKVQWYDGTELAATAVNSNGSFTVSFIVPANAAKGQQIVYFYDFLPEGGWGYFIPATFTVTASCPTPTVTLSAPSGTTEGTITVQGKDWAPGGKVTFALTGAQTGAEQFNLGSVEAADSGEWKRDGFSLWNPPHLLPGVYELLFNEEHSGCELRVTKPYTITEPTITLNPIEGHPGTEVTVQGSGWAAEDTVKIYFAYIGKVYLYDVDDAGRFETTITVPDAVGEYKVIATSVDHAWWTDAVFRIIEIERPPSPWLPIWLAVEKVISSQNFLSWILVGLVVGVVAKFPILRKYPGYIIAILLGIAGALLGGFLGQIFGFVYAVGVITELNLYFLKYGGLIAAMLGSLFFSRLVQIGISPKKGRRHLDSYFSYAPRISTQSPE